MKRVGNVWCKICDIENIRLAHKKAKEDKLYYQEVKMVDSNEDEFLKEIQNMLINNTYKITASDYSVSTIHDKDKDRELWKLSYYPHRIIQWAVMIQIEPVFMKTFCYHTCASIKDRGGKRIHNMVVKWLRNHEKAEYCCKIDIKKFYPHVNHEILKRMLRKLFKDKHLLKLLDMVIDSFPGEIGLPIGSYLSQFLANFYLSYFDHWLKEVKRVKMVCRYMDDIVIFHHSKRYLHRLLVEMAIYLQKELDLEIKSNYQVFPTNIRGVDFVGYRYFYDFILLRKSTCQKFKKSYELVFAKQQQGLLVNRSQWCSINSYMGWLSWCDSWRLWEKYIQPIIPALLVYYRLVILRDKPLKERNKKYNLYRKKLYSKKGRRNENRRLTA